MGVLIEDVLSVAFGLHLRGQPIRRSRQITAVVRLVYTDQCVMHGWRHRMVITTHIQRGTDIGRFPHDFARIL